MLKYLIFCSLPLMILCAVSWEDCGQSDRALSFEKIDIEGDLIVIDGKSSTKADINFSVYETLSQDVIVSSNFKKHLTWPFGIHFTLPIPYSNYASFCDMITTTKNFMENSTVNTNQDYACPLKPGTYLSKFNYNQSPDTIWKIPGLFRKLIGGDVEATLRFYREDKEVGCLTLRSEVQFE